MFVIRERLYAHPVELAILYPNFNYMLSFEMTLKSYEGRNHCTINSVLSGHDIDYRQN
jgi:hypothetical protein